MSLRMQFIIFIAVIFATPQKNQKVIDVNNFTGDFQPLITGQIYQAALKSKENAIMFFSWMRK